MNEVMQHVDAITSTSFPYRLPNTSGSVRLWSSLMNRAKKMAFKMSDSPRPMGRQAPSQK